MAIKFHNPEKLSLGIILASVVTVSLVWLGFTNNLNLYISPRYDLFASFMAALSFMAVTAALAHKGHEGYKLKPIKISALSLGSVAGFLAISLLLLQPKALSSSTALQRGINTGGLLLTTETDTSGFGATDYSQFDIRDWASVLSQTSTISFYTGKIANLSGFVSPTPSKDPNVFFISRFYITCCAMDAQPYGVPIYVPNWDKQYPANSWVTLSGIFNINPSNGKSQPIVVMPVKITSIPVPQDPYGR